MAEFQSNDQAHQADISDMLQIGDTTTALPHQPQQSISSSGAKPFIDEAGEVVDTDTSLISNGSSGDGEDLDATFTTAAADDEEEEGENEDDSEDEEEEEKKDEVRGKLLPDKKKKKRKKKSIIDRVFSSKVNSKPNKKTSNIANVSDDLLAATFHRPKHILVGGIMGRIDVHGIIKKIWN